MHEIYEKILLVQKLFMPPMLLDDEFPGYKRAGHQQYNRNGRQGSASFRFRGDNCGVKFHVQPGLPDWFHLLIWWSGGLFIPFLLIVYYGTKACHP